MNEAFWTHTMEILIMVVVAFLLGVLLGYILWYAFKKKHDALLKEHSSLRERFLTLEKDHVSLKYQHDELEKDNNGLRARVRSLEADLAVMETKLRRAQKALEEATEGQTQAKQDEQPQAPGAAASAAEEAPADDLRKIEGIGPKIADLLQQAGIRTFADLANTSPDRIREILEAAGNRYKMHDPATWPQQARLAAEGKWDELKALQDQLHGGKA